MMPRRFYAFALIFAVQLIGSIGDGTEIAVVDQRLSADARNESNVECLGCGYTPDPPAHGTVPRCADVVCLVQALLDRMSLIYIEQNIDVSGTGPLPDITSEVTIMGTCSEGLLCRIDARGSAQIFVVGLDGYLTLKDLHITGGFCSKGAAVAVSGAGTNDPSKGGKFVAQDCMFSNNVASDVGAALHVESGGVAYIRDCVFRSNKAARGGAVFVGSSAIFPSNHTETEAIRNTCAMSSCTTFVNTEFSRNSAEYGAAVYVDDAVRECKQNGGAKFDCTSCVFRDNSAQQEGGALFINFESAGGVSHLRRSRFSRNNAGINGGDIATQQGAPGARGAQLYAYQVVFSGNKGSNGSAVVVKPFSVSTFAKCEFSHRTPLQCEGSCETLCPMVSPLSNTTVHAGEICPAAPLPLCSWVPPECNELSPAGAPTPSYPSPIPPPLAPPPSLPPAPTLPAPAPAPAPVWTEPALAPEPALVPEPALAPEPAESPGESAQDPRYRGRRPFSPPPHPPMPAPAPAPVPVAAAPARVRGHHRHRNGSITGDPHFVGKHGERFDFHGRSGRDYCILSDKNFHINMHVFKGIHKRSTFISKIGVLFNMDKVLIDAQADKAAFRFQDQWKVVVNDAELPEWHETRTSSGLKIVHLIGSVQIYVLGELDLNVTVRPPGFGRFGSGANYLDFQINQLKVSSSVHGILGQTYQESLRTYKKIHNVRDRRLKRSRAATLFVDGAENDYLASGIMEADCKYSAYLDQSRLSHRVQRMVLEGVEVLLGKREETVRQCTGFGHSLCLSELENDDS